MAEEGGSAVAVKGVAVEVWATEAASAASEADVEGASAAATARAAAMGVTVEEERAL